MAYQSNLPAFSGAARLTPRKASRLRRRATARVELLTDEELLIHSEAHPEMFAELYRRQSRPILIFLTRRTACAQSAADLTAETFTVAFARRRSYEPELGNVRQWLFGIARNLVRDAERREYRMRRLVDRVSGLPRLDADEIERVEHLADLPELRRSVHISLDALPASQASAVRHRVLEERSYADTAAQLGISEVAARIRVSRGLRRLSELLGDV